MPHLLLITGSAGPSPHVTVPKLAKIADVVVVPLAPLPADLDLPPGVVVVPGPVRVRGSRLVDELVALGERYAADGIVTFSEWSVISVALAAGRLGLPGAGPNVLLARDKLRMRQRWAASGLPVPRFRAVAGPRDISAAVDEFGEPVLLKARYGCGSLAQTVVETPADADGAWGAARRAIAEADADGDLDAARDLDLDALMVETLIPGTVESWYETAGYGDYLSVEGLLIDGRWHPVCITARLPTVPPFTELSNQAPCVLPEPLQRAVERTAREAVEALGLHTCGTHTELKLLRDRQLCLLETAARLGGAAITREVESVHGVDLVTQLGSALLGLPTDLPGSMLVRGKGAAASVALLATDSAGKPWTNRPTWSPERVDWASLLSPGSSLDVVQSSTIPSGTPMPVYDLATGTRNFAGLAFVEAADAQTLLRDTYAVLDGLEAALVRAQTAEGSRTPDAGGHRHGDGDPAAVCLTRGAKDAAEVADLFVAAGLNGPVDDLPRMQRMLDTSQEVICARAPDGLLVGLIRVLTDYSFNAFVADLAVRPQWQRRGVGSRLVDEATREHPGVKFVVHPGHASGPFWARCGFDAAPGCLVRARRA